MGTKEDLILTVHTALVMSNSDRHTMTKLQANKPKITCLASAGSLRPMRMRCYTRHPVCSSTTHSPYLPVCLSPLITQ